MATDWNLTTPHGPLRVVLTDATHAAIMTPSNWGSYPDLQWVVRGHRVGALHVYLTLAADGTWGPTPDSAGGVYVNRANNKPASPATLAAALAVALETLARVLAEHPDAPMVAETAARHERATRARARLVALDAQRETVMAELRSLEACPAHERRDRHTCAQWRLIHDVAEPSPTLYPRTIPVQLPGRVPVPDRAICHESSGPARDCTAPATRMLLYRGKRAGVVQTVADAVPFCDPHADAILSAFPHAYQDVTAEPVPVPAGATCSQTVEKWNPCPSVATRMLLYTGRPGAGSTHPPAQPFCDPHAAAILAGFPSTYQDVTDSPDDDAGEDCAACCQPTGPDVVTSSTDAVYHPACVPTV